MPSYNNTEELWNKEEGIAHIFKTVKGGIVNVILFLEIGSHIFFE